MGAILGLATAKTRGPEGRKEAPSSALGGGDPQIRDAMLIDMGLIHAFMM